MNSIKIYRGTNQIGGIVTEFMNGDHRILIDFGANLPGTVDAKINDDKLVEMVFGDKENPRGADAVLFTHYHGDHVGLKDRIPDGIDMYIGDTAKAIMKTIAARVDHMNKRKKNDVRPELPLIDRMKPYWKSGTARDIGGISVTPLLCDHSAIDAYMFLIEMNGKRILYTGDFREHGIPGSETFENTIKTNVGKVDILVTEGTMIFRTKEIKNSAVRDEGQLGEEAKKIFTAHKENVVLVSSTNLDSIMEFYHATPSEKAFLCDPYQAEIMKLAI
nr:MBL fold metallo-hydrolase [Lachnospiraceae bacterium]